MRARPVAAAVAAAGEGLLQPPAEARRPEPARRPQRAAPHLERPPVVAPHPRRLSAAPGQAAAVAARRSLAASRSATRCNCRRDGKTWSAPVAQGAGSPATIVATFRPTQAKFVRVTQTGTAENAPAWSVLNFRVYAAGSAPGALTRETTERTKATNSTRRHGDPETHEGPVAPRVARAVSSATGDREHPQEHPGALDPR